MGYRKFIVIILFLFIMSLFRVYDLISGADFASNLQIAVVAYFGTNFGEHISKAYKNKDK